MEAEGELESLTKGPEVQIRWWGLGELELGAVEPIYQALLKDDHELLSRASQEWAKIHQELGTALDNFDCFVDADGMATRL